MEQKDKEILCIILILVVLCVLMILSMVIEDKQYHTKARYCLKESSTDNFCNCMKGYVLKCDEGYMNAWKNELNKSE